MRLVIQRVASAEVKVVTDDKVVGKIKDGLFVLVGVKKGDTKGQAEYLADKLVKLRVMKDKGSKMNLSVEDAGAEILAVSQFTLYSDSSKGNRPSFIKAEEPTKAKEIYEYFLDQLKKKEVRVETGKFGEYMFIQTQLDGPVTIILEN